MDVLTLSRLQFAITIMFHYLFPPLTIGLGIVMVYLEGMYLWTKDSLYEMAAKFWTKIFAINFALGVVTGIVMEFQFGTNWAVYSRYVGDVFGSALAAEGVFAFFLESGFLAVLVFGWDRVGPRMHFFSTVMVSLGSIFSSVWIVIANSWQQTPTGFVMREKVINGQVFLRAEIYDFWEMVFNPSSMHRLIHVWIGSLVLGSFFVMSVSAYYILKNRHSEFAKRSFTGGLLLGTVASLGTLISGHFQAHNVHEHQPAKMAAMEGLYKTEGSVPLYIVGWPNDETQQVEWAIPIPGALSFLLKGDFEAEIEGLDELDDKYGRPPVWLTFQAYHIMVGIGFLFIFFTLFGCFFWLRGTLFQQRWLLKFFVGAVALAFVANHLGWVTAEAGRQPWVVYPTFEGDKMVSGLLVEDALSERFSPTADDQAAAEAADGVPIETRDHSGEILASIIMFSLVYSLLFVLWIVFLNRKIQAGPEPVKSRAKPGTEELLRAASARVDHYESMTEANRVRADEEPPEREHPDSGDQPNSPGAETEKEDR